jgi:hypothetical protein
LIMIAEFRGEKRFDKTRRLFQALHNVIILTEAIYIAASESFGQHVIRNRSGTIAVECSSFPIQIKLSIGYFGRAARCEAVKHFELRFEAKAPPPPHISNGKWTSAFVNIVLMPITLEFVSFTRIT